MPQDFSFAIDLQATRVGLTGEKGDYNACYKECFWEYQTLESDDIGGLATSFEQLQQTFSRRVKQIQQFMHDYNLQARFVVVVKIKKQENPGIFFNSQFLGLMHELGASIDIDVTH